MGEIMTETKAPRYTAEERDRVLDYIAADVVGTCPGWEQGDYYLPRGTVTAAGRIVGCIGLTASRWWDDLTEEDRQARMQDASRAREKARALAASVLPEMIEHLAELCRRTGKTKDLSMAIRAIGAIVDGDRPPEVALAGVTMLTGDRPRGKGDGGGGKRMAPDMARLEALEAELAKKLH